MGQAAAGWQPVCGGQHPHPQHVLRQWMYSSARLELEARPHHAAADCKHMLTTTWHALAPNSTSASIHHAPTTARQHSWNSMHSSSHLLSISRAARPLLHQILADGLDALCGCHAGAAKLVHLRQCHNRAQVGAAQVGWACVMQQKEACSGHVSATARRPACDYGDQVPQPVHHHSTCTCNICHGEMQAISMHDGQGWAPIGRRRPSDRLLPGALLGKLVVIQQPALRRPLLVMCHSQATTKEGPGEPRRGMHERRQAAAAPHLPVRPAREGRGGLQHRRLGDDGLHALAQRPAAPHPLRLPGRRLQARRPAGGQTLPRRWHRHAWPRAAQSGLLLHRLLHTGRARSGKAGRARQRRWSLSSKGCRAFHNAN